MDSGFWYYTFSAIPQTLGAVIALVATFSIFKLSKIHDLVEKSEDGVRDYLYLLCIDKGIHDIESMSARDIIANLTEGIKGIHLHDANYPTYDTLRDLFTDELKRRHRSHEATPEMIYDFLVQKRDRLAYLQESRERTIRRLGISFFVNTASIAASLILLPNYGELTTYRWEWVGVVVIMAILSLGYTMRAAWKTATFE